MKRLIFVATLAILAVGCQKTDVNNPVENPIGFSAETGKQTRAIVSGNTYPTAQPFAVYAHGKQSDVYTNTIMDNVEVSYDSKWAATLTGSIKVKYYWPNDPRTTIDFYAYSPAHKASNATTGLANHMVLNADANVGQAVDGSFQLNGYVHDNMYVDFMVATPIKKATYSDQDGTTGTATGLTSVPLSFHHQMTQVIFNVKTKEAYAGVKFTVNSIKFNNIFSVANFVHDYSNAYGEWTAVTPITYNNVFPALATNGGVAADETEFIVDNTPEKTLKTTPVTMIPQILTDQSFTIEYEISGDGVATETVVKTFEFTDATSAPAWAPNKKITYTLTIGLNEITFEPSVVDWDDSTSGSYDI